MLPQTLSLAELVRAMPEQDWDFEALSANPQIRLDFIKENRKLPWNFDGLSQNPNINMDFVLENNTKKWNWRHLSGNPGITLKDILANTHIIGAKGVEKVIPWNWSRISQNASITIYDISNNPHYFNADGDEVPTPWNWTSISINPNINLAFVKANSDKRFLSQYFCMNPGLSLYEISGLVYPMDYDWLSHHPNITIEYILEHPAERWDWTILTAHPNIRIEDIRKYSWMKWDMTMIHANPNMTSKLADMRSRRNIHLLSGNARLTFDEVFDNPDLWNFSELSANKNR